MAAVSRVSGDSVGRVVNTGWLHIKRKRIVGKSWKKMWFVLFRDRTLCGWNDKEDQVQQKPPMKKFQLTEEWSVGLATVKANAFGLFSATKTVLLQAGTEALLETWMDAITRVVVPQDSVGLEDFELLALVGTGAFGKVIQVKKLDNGNIYAMKVLNKKDVLTTNQVRSTKTEKRVLEVVNHPFIVRLHYAFQTTDKLCFVMDFVNGGDIFGLIQRTRKLPETWARFYSAQIVMCLEYLHTMGIVYRDLKPENVMIDKHGFLKLTDFGLSNDAVADRTYSIVGSAFYIAPEIVLKQGHDQAADWWSLGILTYEMMVGVPPHFDRSVSHSKSYQLLLTTALPIPSGMSPDAASLLKGLIEPNPRARIGGALQTQRRSTERRGSTDRDELAAPPPEEVRCHPFFSSLDWDALYHKQVEPPWHPQVASDADISHFDVPAGLSLERYATADDDEDEDIDETYFQDFEFYSAPDDFLSSQSGSASALSSMQSSPRRAPSPSGVGGSVSSPITIAGRSPASPQQSPTAGPVDASPPPSFTPLTTPLGAPALKNFLVPIDARAVSAKALQVAAQLCQRQGPKRVRVTLLAVVTSEDQVAHGKSLLDRSKVNFECVGVTNTKTEVRVGELPAQAIIQYADTHQSDCIVMSTHGRTGVQRTFLGSVTETVIRERVAAVLVASQDMAVDHTLATSALRICCPVDGSKVSVAGLKHAVRLAKAAGNATVTPVMISKTEDVKRTNEAVARCVGEIGKDPMITPRVVISTKPPVDALLDIVGEYSMVVMGSNARKGLKRIALRSVAEKIVRLSPVPVLVVPKQKLSDNHQQHGHFQRTQSQTLVDGTLAGGSQRPEMVKATEFLDECGWDYHRAVHGLLSAMVNREQVHVALAPDTERGAAVARTSAHPGIRALAIEVHKEFERHAQKSDTTPRV